MNPTKARAPAGERPRNDRVTVIGNAVGTAVSVAVFSTLLWTIGLQVF
ncbi:hypothetical protein [Microvirga roseola]|nr:hypothetical protein [Microvirga roseola]